MVDERIGIAFKELWDLIPETQSAESRGAFSRFSNGIGGFPEKRTGLAFMSVPGLVTDKIIKRS